MNILDTYAELWKPSQPRTTWSQRHRDWSRMVLFPWGSRIWWTFIHWTYWNFTGYWWDSHLVMSLCASDLRVKLVKPDDERWWKMIKDHEKWWKMMKYDELWWNMMKDWSMPRAYSNMIVTYPHWVTDGKHWKAPTCYRTVIVPKCRASKSKSFFPVPTKSVQNHQNNQSNTCFNATEPKTIKTGISIPCRWNAAEMSPKPVTLESTGLIPMQHIRITMRFLFMLMNYELKPQLVSLNVQTRYSSCFLQSAKVKWTYIASTPYSWW